MLTVLNSSHDPFYNQAFEEYVFEHFRQGEIFLLWQNSPAVVVGSYQNICREVHVERLRQLGIPVIRRITGGGTVYHDLGNLNYTYISDGGAAIDYDQCLGPILAALNDIGVPARKNRTCDIAIFANDSIKHTGVLALGGQNLTNDIAFGLRTPMAAAEKIKIKHGAAIAEMVRPDEYIEVPSVGGREPRRLSRQVLAEICEPRMEEILTLLDQELVRSGLKNMIGAGVVLTGGTALIQGCQELGEQVFNLPTRIGYPRNVGGLKDMVNSPKFATAMGLLRFGAEKEGMEQKFRIRSDGNVFNSILSRMKKWFSEIS